MSKAPVMPFFTDAYLADTHHLSTEAHGAYLLLLLSTWRNNGEPFADDDALLQRVTRLPMRRWKTMRTTLLPFFNVSDGFWRQKRLEENWRSVMEKISVNRANSLKGVAARRGGTKPLNENDMPFANGQPVGAGRFNPTINHEPINQTESKEKNSCRKREPEKNTQTMPPNVSPDDAPGLRPIADACPSALELLRPLLMKHEYFTSARAVLPEVHEAEVTSALAEVKARLAPARAEDVRDVVSRLFTHFPVPAGANIHSMMRDYEDMLSHSPLAILRHAYQHILTTHKYHTLPKIADFKTQVDGQIDMLRFFQLRLQKLQTNCLKSEV